MRYLGSGCRLSLSRTFLPSKVLVPPIPSRLLTDESISVAPTYLSIAQYALEISIFRLPRPQSPSVRRGDGDGAILRANTPYGSISVPCPRPQSTPPDCPTGASRECVCSSESLVPPILTPVLAPAALHARLHTSPDD